MIFQKRLGFNYFSNDFSKPGNHLFKNSMTFPGFPWPYESCIRSEIHRHGCCWCWNTGHVKVPQYLERNAGQQHTLKVLLYMEKKPSPLTQLSCSFEVRHVGTLLCSLARGGGLRLSNKVRMMNETCCVTLPGTCTLQMREYYQAHNGGHNNDIFHRLMCESAALWSLRNILHLNERLKGERYSV